MKDKYTKPTIKIIEFEVEMGYAASGFSGSSEEKNGMMNFMWFADSDNEQNINTGASFEDSGWLN